jgi:hypothetical protein
MHVVALVAVSLLVASATPIAAADDDEFLSGKASAWKRTTTTGLADTPDYLVVKTGGGYVALDDLPTGSGVATYTSRDGRTWEAASTNGGGFASDAGLSSLAAGSKGLIASGLIGAEDQRQTVFWSSKDGKQWTQTPPDPTAFGGPGANAGVNGVVEGPKGYVAVGYDGTGNGLNAAVWTSKDGAEWTRVAPVGDLAEAVPGEMGFVMFDVTYARKTYLAVGTRRFADATGKLFEEPAIWTSRDASRWTRQESGVSSPTAFVADSGGAKQVRLTLALATDRGFVGAGNQVHSERDYTMGGLALFSRNGTEWTPARADGQPFAFPPTSTTETALKYGASIGGGAVITGLTRRAANQPSTAKIWASEDGRTWTSAKGEQVEGYVEGPVAGNSRGAVVLGYPYQSDGTPTVAWIGGKP